MKKRGFVTPFIVAGLLILITIGVFVLMRNYVYLGKFVPSPIVPITIFTQECVKQTTEDALFFARTQGGYIYLPETIAKDKESYVNLGLKVPLWFYKFQDRAPTKNDIELDIEKYVKENLLNCLNNFQQFSNEFSVEATKATSGKSGTSEKNISSNDFNNDFNIDDIEVQSTINTHDVTINVNLPIQLKRITKGSSQIYSFPKIETKVNTDFGQMYQLATKIMKQENEEAFLEGYVIDMIASSEYLPHEGMEITCQPRSWAIAKIDEYLKNVIMHNIKFLTFKNTKFEPSNIPYFDKIYQVELGGTIGISGTSNKLNKLNENKLNINKLNDFSNIKVNTIYNPEWQLNVDVQPKHGDTVKPIEYDPTKFFFNCIKIYHHKYSVNFPIMFQLISDDNPEDMFYFATPVIMTHDEPDRYGNVPAWPEEVDRTGSEKYCSNTTSISIFNLDKAGNIVVQPSLQENRKVQLDVYAFDAVKGYPEGALKDVKISYHCVKFRCEIGTTELPTSEEGYYVGDAPMLSAKFPSCFNGYIIAEKEGYLTARQKITISDENNNNNNNNNNGLAESPESFGTSVNIEMKPLKDIDYEVKVIEDKNNIITERNMVKGEAAIVMISAQSAQDSGANNFEQTVFYPPEYIEEDNTEAELFETSTAAAPTEKEKTTTTSPYTNLKLIVSNNIPYTVDIKLVKDEQIWGGASYNWTPSMSQITTNNKIIFYVTKKETLLPPQTPEEWKKLYDDSLKTSTQYPPKMVYLWEKK
ncbi:hypothetical protein J4434_01970 [Candidatus Woesearchaeota archaeon]|nr:hypothetical protein [Candidatus Woesearchaeota archaeon]